MVLVIIAGHIDLSVGSVAAFVGITVAIAMRDWGIPWWVGILLGLNKPIMDVFLCSRQLNVAAELIIRQRSS